MTDVATVVDRARAGDRSATAQLRRIAAAARAGDRRAVAAYHQVKEHIGRNPPGSTSMGIERVAPAPLAPPKVHVTINTKAIHVWGGIAGGGALLGGLLWGVKGAIILGVGVPVMAGALLYSALRHLQ